ncbi:MAG: hypothetical protein ACRC5H_00500 [Treponemataceae bacterium]
MSEIVLSDIDLQYVKNSIQNNTPIEVKTCILSHEEEVHTISLLESFLKEINQLKIFDYLSYCVRELMVNAKKANTKRVFFLEKKLDLEDEAQYEMGMVSFKKETLSNIDYFLKKQAALNLYVKTIFYMKSETCLVVEVRNNAKLTFIEYKRIHDKIARAQQYSSINEPLTQVMDNSEGAGFGLVILMIMLRKVGLNDDGYDVFIDGEETVIRVTLNLDNIDQE